VTYFQNFWTPL